MCSVMKHLLGSISSSSSYSGSYFLPFVTMFSWCPTRRIRGPQPGFDDRPVEHVQVVGVPPPPRFWRGSPEPPPPLLAGHQCLPPTRKVPAQGIRCDFLWRYAALTDIKLIGFSNKCLKLKKNEHPPFGNQIPGGGISPRINFGGQISLLVLPTKFFQQF
jgi:hypothetical protein